MWAPSTKCWTAPWRRRPSPALLAALACAALAVPGCVTRQAHERALDDLRSELAGVRQEALDKDRSIGALESEREKLLGEVEDAARQRRCDGGSPGAR